ncbi:tyrosine-type recombinase/integrase [Mycolicibacterium neoaurum]|uniref:tyrosine-type recombinase/integrase n=1 Tax=Mycolicibacterium neoaurum TaxID=1795 RepID=UPI003AB994CE
MAAMHVRDADMLQRRVHVRQAVAVVRGGLVWSTPKSHEHRSVPFPAFLASELAASMVGERSRRTDLRSCGGGVLRVSNWRPRVFNKAVNRLTKSVRAFLVVTPHDLRHAVASQVISTGANVKDVQTMLGHASAVLSLEHLCRPLPGRT